MQSHIALEMMLPQHVYQIKLIKKHDCGSYTPHAAICTLYLQMSLFCWSYLPYTYNRFNIMRVARKIYNHAQQIHV